MKNLLGAMHIPQIKKAKGKKLEVGTIVRAESLSYCSETKEWNQGAVIISVDKNGRVTPKFIEYKKK